MSGGVAVPPAVGVARAPRCEAGSGWHGEDAAVGGWPGCTGALRTHPELGVDELLALGAYIQPTGDRQHARTHARTHAPAELPPSRKLPPAPTSCGPGVRLGDRHVDSSSSMFTPSRLPSAAPRCGAGAGAGGRGWPRGAGALRV